DDISLSDETNTEDDISLSDETNTEEDTSVIGETSTQSNSEINLDWNIDTQSFSTYSSSVSTSTKPFIYSNFTTSSAYKKYPAIRTKGSIYYPIPGLKQTNVNGVACKRMTPQGMCFAKDYMLITAYDSDNKYRSVIYVMKNDSSHSYITTLVLNSRSHVGGIAYGGGYVWVSHGTQVEAISYQDIVNAVNKRKDSLSIKSYAYCNTLSQTSTLTYAGGKLWVGTYNEKSNGKLYGYTVTDNTYTVTLTKSVGPITLPPKTQGIAIRDNKIFINTSFGRQNNSTLYIKNFTRNKIGSLLKSITLPPMAEGICVGSTYTYLLFESAAYKCVYQDPNDSCPSPVDRVCGIKTASLVN
ncbi:MAG TPA: hypothetical protein VF941_07110, partial [Clostridia bacterium]